MARAKIDPRVIARLIVVQTETLPATISKRYFGEPQDRQMGPRQVIIEGVDIEYTPRQSGGDEQDMAKITVSISVVTEIDNDRDTIYALEETIAQVVDKLTEVGLSDATTTHQVELLRASVTIDKDNDPDARIRSARIEIPGRADRKTGSTYETN